MKGRYSIRCDTLVITGVYTHANYKMKVAGCYRSGYLNYWYLVKDTSSDRNCLLLRNMLEHATLKLTKLNAASLYCPHP